MTNDRDAGELRARALARLAAAGGDASSEPSMPDMQRMIHELQVHQIELELQNEELVRARGQVEAGLARYSDLYEHAPIGYMTLGGAGEIVQLNLAAARLLGGERARLVGRHLGTLLPADQRPLLRTLLTSMLGSAGRSVCEVRIENDGVAAAIVELAGVRIDDGDRFRVVASDVSEARRATRALLDSEVRYRTLFELSREALVTLVPPSWRFSSGNRAALGLFGVDDEGELRARTMTELSPTRQPDGVDSSALAALHLEPAMRDGTRVFEWRIRGRNGVELPATVSLTRMEVDGVSLLHASLRDETEARAQQARMAQADRLASLGLLAASVAHEINNPLAYVLYNLETVAADLPRLGARLGAAQLDEAALDDLVARATEALSGTQRIRDVVRGLASFSRVDNAEQTRVDINGAIGAAIDLASNEIRHRARLVTELGDVPAVLASEGKLSQVLLNLLLNAAHALDACTSQDPRITVRTWTEGDVACVSVADTGCGIAPEHLGHIFDPFFTTKGIGHGSGLGLAISRNLVAELGGAMTVESTLGAGSTFVVRLPAFAPAKAAEPSPAIPEPPRSRVRGRVLVVDDELMIRNTLARLIGDDHEVTMAASGAAAQAILTADADFDLILCDLMMPEMTGMELHAWICGRSRVLAARVVFITGGAFTDGAVEYLEQAGNLQISKPFDTANLRFLVSDLVAAARS